MKLRVVSMASTAQVAAYYVKDALGGRESVACIHDAKSFAALKVNHGLGGACHACVMQPLFPGQPSLSARLMCSGAACVLASDTRPKDTLRLGMFFWGCVACVKEAHHATTRGCPSGLLFIVVALSQHLSAMMRAMFQFDLTRSVNDLGRIRVNRALLLSTSCYKCDVNLYALPLATAHTRHALHASPREG